MNRRRIITSTGTTAIIALAGCTAKIQEALEEDPEPIYITEEDLGDEFRRDDNPNFPFVTDDTQAVQLVHELEDVSFGVNIGIRDCARTDDHANCDMDSRKDHLEYQEIEYHELDLGEESIGWYESWRYIVSVRTSNHVFGVTYQMIRTDDMTGNPDIDLEALFNDANPRETAKWIAEQQLDVVIEFEE